jgi:hypothetical protein
MWVKPRGFGRVFLAMLAVEATASVARYGPRLAAPGPRRQRLQGVWRPRIATQALAILGFVRSCATRTPTFDDGVLVWRPAHVGAQSGDSIAPAAGPERSRAPNSCQRPRAPKKWERRLEAGDSFLVVRDEQPLAEVRPVSAPVAQLRPFGLCAGQFHVPADFDRPLPDDLLKDFEEA